LPKAFFPTAFWKNRVPCRVRGPQSHALLGAGEKKRENFFSQGFFAQAKKASFFPKAFLPKQKRLLSFPRLSFFRKKGLKKTLLIVQL